MPIATQSSTFSLQVQAPAVCQHPDMNPALPNGSPGEQSKFSSMPPKCCVAQLRFFQNPPPPWLSMKTFVQNAPNPFLFKCLGLKANCCSLCRAMQSNHISQQGRQVHLDGTPRNLFLFISYFDLLCGYLFHNRSGQRVLDNHQHFHLHTCSRTQRCPLSSSAQETV